MITVYDTKLIKHVWSTAGTIWELQALSKLDGKWYAVITDRDYDEVVEHTKKYPAYPLPDTFTVEYHK